MTAVLYPRRSFRAPRALLLWLPLVAACGGAARGGPDGPGPITDITVSPSPDTVFVAGSNQLVAVAKDADGATVTGTSFSWQSGNAGIAVVTTTGQVTGVAAGQTTVTASAGGITGGATVVVRLAPAGSVQVTPGADSVATGSVLFLAAQVRDAGGTPLPGVQVTWSSDNSSIATVTTAGFVTGVSAGTATITAGYNGVTGSAQVKVRAPFTRQDGSLVPLNDLGNGRYLGFPGFLYPGSNALPAAHLAAGLSFANAMVPRDVNGNPSGSGKVLLMSVGMSNTTQEWCTKFYLDPCNSWSFTGQAAGDARVKTGTFKIVNGARGGETADKWVFTNDSNYNRVRDSVLAPQGLSEKQVQAIWLKVAHSGPTVGLPDAGADAFLLAQDVGRILRTFKSRYPNLKAVFVSSRIYAGYATTPLNPEPYAYESGLAMQWVVNAQIRQMASGGTLVDPLIGNLNYSDGTAPWVTWGPYLWANGTMARSDGLQWFSGAGGDFENDGTHPSDQGELKVGGLLVSFFATSPVTRCWFTNGGTCP